MKKFMIMSVLVLSSFIYKAADAQVNVNINIGTQPEWGPAGYNRAQYYYLPDIDVYYHVSDRTFTYYEGNRWITSASLPARYHNYDLYRGYKVVVNESRPWVRHNEHIVRYAAFKGRHDQKSIRDSRDAHYADRNNNRPDGRMDSQRDNRNDRSSFPGRPQRKS